jgi:hypothetical protein
VELQGKKCHALYNAGEFRYNKPDLFAEKGVSPDARYLEPLAWLHQVQ